jgi:hypothetical protein
MSFRKRFLLTFFVLLATGDGLGFARAAEPADASPASEATRLYDSAHDYVQAIKEGEYSYSYMQFYWKRAQANLDRISRVYPNTPVGAQLKSGSVKIGDFDLPYFKDRVLFRLEQKRIAAVDSVNCAIFLCELKGETWDTQRRDALMKIIEALSRQKRWGEALKFPVLPVDDQRKLETIFRVAARYDQADLVKQILTGIKPEDTGKRRSFDAILGEAIALRGRSREDIAKLLDQDPADEVKLAILSGMIERETIIQRTAALRLPLNHILLEGDSVKNPDVRDDVDAVAKTFFPSGNPAAQELLARFRAGLGTKPALNAPVAVHLSYLEYLEAAEKYDDLTAYLRFDFPTSARTPIELKVLELLAEAGRAKDAEALRLALSTKGGLAAEEATLAQFRGQMRSTLLPLVVHQKTLAEIPFTDPAYLAGAMTEWSLTPNRSIRGPAPYDAVVYKFAPGFANIPQPKSQAVQDASSASKPF